MAHQDERQFDNLLDNLVSELAMEEVGEPDEPIVRMPEPTPPPAAHATRPHPTRRPARTWVAVTGILAAAGATLAVAAFVIFGGTRAEAAHARPKTPPAPAVEPAPAPMVPVLVPQPAPAANPTPSPDDESAAAAEIPTPAEASASAKKPDKKKRKKRRRRSRKRSRKAPPSGDRFEDL